MSPPAPPPAPAERRAMNTNSATSSSVGPKPKMRLSAIEGPLLVGWALIVTPSERRELNSDELSAKDGIWVEKFVDLAVPGGYATAFLSVPEIASPVEEIELTFLASTSLRNVGL